MALRSLDLAVAVNITKKRPVSRAPCRGRRPVSYRNNISPVGCWFRRGELGASL